MTGSYRNRYSGYGGPDLERIRSVMQHAYAAGRQCGLSEADSILDAAQAAIAREWEGLEQKIEAVRAKLEGEYIGFIQELQADIQTRKLRLRLQALDDDRRLLQVVLHLPEKECATPHAIRKCGCSEDRIALVDMPSSLLRFRADRTLSRHRRVAESDR